MSAEANKRAAVISLSLWQRRVYGWIGVVKKELAYPVKRDGGGVGEIIYEYRERTENTFLSLPLCVCVCVCHRLDD